MAKPIQMPALSPTMTEGKITRWNKKVGDRISSGDAVAEVETDKSNLEIEAYDDGYLLAITVNEGEVAQVGAPIGYIGEKGEKIEEGAAAPAAKPAQPAPTKAEAPKPSAPAPSAQAKPGGPRATPVQMPALSPTMTEGKITRWLKKEGDKVSSGEAIAEVETDKSNLQIESYEEGELLRIDVAEGEMAPVGKPIAWIGPKGAQIVSAEEPPAEERPAAPAAATQAAAQAAAPTPRPPAAPPPRAEAPARARPTGRILASPLAKRMAKERGLDLAAIEGTGPQGRIIKRDVEAALARGVPKRAAAPAGVPVRPVGARPEPRTEPLSTMRRVIAQRMTEVKPGVPHFYLTVDIDMDAALAIREEAKAQDAKVSVNDIIVKAMAIALRRVPQMNVSFAGDHLVQYDTVDVGVAVALDEGLITPIIRDADIKGLAEIAAESRELAERARNRRLKPEEYTGGSITISNLGMYGIDEFVAVINPPQASILAVGAANDRVVARGGQMVIRKVMTATLSCDHRAVDGALGAQYLKALKELLEHPLRLLF